MSQKFPKETVLNILRQVELGAPLRQLRREYGFSEASFYYWRAKHGTVLHPGGRTYHDLEAENRRLKILLAEAVCRLNAFDPHGHSATAIHVARDSQGV